MAEMQPYAVGDRVVSLDPDRPYGDRGMVSHGTVVAISDEYVDVLLDWLRVLDEGNPNRGRTSRFAVSELDRHLAFEEHYLADPHGTRPARAAWVRDA